jgi:uridine monophosphate synthetase
VIDKESLISGLYEAGAIRFGEVSILAPGQTAMHIDFQALASRPMVLRRVARIMQQQAAELTYDRLGAIPLGGLTVGMTLSLTIDKPLIYPRPLSNESNAGRLIAGEYKAGETILMIDDLILDGKSQIEALTLFQIVRLKVTDLLVILDREMGGKQKLEEKGYKVHPILTIAEILDTLLQLHKISPEQHQFLSKWAAESAARDAGLPDTGSLPPGSMLKGSGG